MRSLAEQVPGIDYYEKDEDGQTPLHRAVYGGELEATEFLLPHYSIDAELGDDEGNWPLHVAAEEDEVECVKALLEFDPKGINRPNHKGETALHRAAYHDHESVVTCLIGAAGVNLNALNDKGLTILHRAIINHKTNTALLIIREGRSLATAGLDKDGWTALHHAAANGNEAVVRQLLDCGCDPHPEAEFTKTPFWLALTYQQVEVVDLYVARGLGDVAGRRARMYNSAVAAAGCGNLDLWRRFVGLDKDLAAGLDYNGDNALCIAAFAGNGHMLEDMIALNLDINSKSGLGDTALIRASHGGELRSCDTSAREVRISTAWTSMVAQLSTGLSLGDLTNARAYWSTQKPTRKYAMNLGSSPGTITPTSNCCPVFRAPSSATTIPAALIGQRPDDLYTSPLIVSVKQTFARQTKG